MKKITIFLISIVLSMLLAYLIYYGYKHRRGIPAAVEEPVQAEVLSTTFIDKDIDFSKGIDQSFWSTVRGKDFGLTYQLMAIPWPKSGAVKSVYISSFYNKKNIYFFMKWEDTTENRKKDLNIFPDAAAIMFSLNKEIKPTSIMMGFMSRVNIWHWKGNDDNDLWGQPFPEKKVYVDYYYPFEKEELFPVSKNKTISAVKDLLSKRVATLTLKEEQRVKGRGIWKNEKWQVVFKRSLKIRNPDIDADFSSDKKRFCAFAVWNGEKEDRGGRKSISRWIELEVKR